jgi:hypothetical protein
VAFALESGATAEERLAGMLAVAQSKAETATTQKMLALETSELSEVLHTFHDHEEEGLEEAFAQVVEAPPAAPSAENEKLQLDSERQGQSPPGASSSSTLCATPLGEDRADGAPLDQVQAVFVKNLVLQSKQKCSNCCSVFFVVLMFLLLYIMSLVFKSVESIDVCDQGYLTEQDCSQSTLVDHIFSGSWDDMVEDDYNFQDDDTVGPYGYTIKYYMVPSEQWSGNIEFFGDISSNYYQYGLPQYPDRTPIIWSSLSDSAELVDVSQALGLQFSARSIPEAAAASADASNSFMWDTQLAVAADVARSQEEGAFPHCYEYAEDFVVNATSWQEVRQNYSDVFADSVIYCETCNSTAERLNETEMYFDGTVWCAETVENCYDSACEVYPYGFLNFYLQGYTGQYSYLGSGCPLGIDKVSMTSNNDWTPSTYRVMSYLNLLSNSVLNPTLQSFDIQGGVSPYGDLNFDAQLISQNLANILTVIGMMLLNGFWPLAVWRLAHERANNIVLMVHTSGMRKASYMAGMFLFDMAVSVVSGVGMIVFAVLLGLSRFDGAPVGYLVAIVVFSAMALNGGAQLMVILSRKKATVLPLLAPCLMVASVVISSLLNILVYPDDGDWKWPLSLYPFLAQGRALYLLLVYHRGTPEVDLALVLMALFGIGSLALTFVLEMESELRLVLSNWIASLRGQKQKSPACDEDPAGHVVSPAALGCDEESARQDDDVLREEQAAMAYRATSKVEAGAHEAYAHDPTMAIVLQQLRHVFPNGFQAVKDLSLALKFGECFG